MPKQIALTQGKFTIVSDEDFDELSKYKWYAMKGVNTWYASRNGYDANGKRRTFKIHNILFPDAKLIDHQDNDGLNNTRENLRNATVSQNDHNQVLHRRKDKSSRFKGVTWVKRHSRWQAQINYNSKYKYLGEFVSEEAAARVYDAVAAEYFGEFAKTNAMLGLL